jgi:phage baseplate assembly protein V
VRIDLRALANRVYLMIARATITSANDAPAMQEVDVRIGHDEAKTGVERFQNYGFTSVPLPGDGAEAIIVRISGSPSHPVVIAIDDRRYRPKNLQGGESALYDDQGQQIYISRAGIVITGGPSKKPVNVTVGSANLLIQDGQLTGSIAGAPMIQATASRVDLGGLGGQLVRTIAGQATKVYAV